MAKLWLELVRAGGRGGLPAEGGWQKAGETMKGSAGVMMACMTRRNSHAVHQRCCSWLMRLKDLESSVAEKVNPARCLRLSISQACLHASKLVRQHIIEGNADLTHLEINSDLCISNARERKLVCCRCMSLCYG